ncbi:MAG: CehA/McbA family metallohydrolase, partial [Candidatus Latescibacteria bacterium]|nr:CehA/McbA family metallohydrolase [Candidatus Latescibacterota bacterium]
DVSLVPLAGGLPDKIVISAKPISNNRRTRVQVVVEDSSGGPVVDGTVVLLDSGGEKNTQWSVCKNGQASFVLEVGEVPVGGHTVWARSGDAYAQSVVHDVLAGRIVGRLLDADTQRVAFADVVVQDSLSQIVLRRPFLGEFEVSVPPGIWYITAQAGPTRLSPELQRVEVVAEDSVMVDLSIGSWVDLTARGWLAGDLNVRGSVGKLQRPVSIESATLATRAAGLNWALFTNSWDTTQRQYRPQDLTLWSDPFYGFWGRFFETASGDTWTVGDAAQAAPDVFGAQVLVHRNRGLVGHTRLFTSQRHTSRVIFDALSGPTFDCLDVMSERPDDVQAQKLWFDLLNRGYRIAATASTGAALDDVAVSLPGKYRTYVQVDGEVTPGRLTQALANGQSFVSSGPLLQFSVFAAGPGSDLPVGRKRRATIRAWARADVNDYLTRVELIRNGEIAQAWDLDDQPRTHKQAVTLQDSVDCWYIVKCYGADRSQVALTNPIYFRSPDFKSPEPVQAMVRGEIETADGKSVDEAQVLVKNALGEVILKTIAREGRFQLWASPTSLIEVQTQGYKGVQQRIIDNTQLVNLLDELQDVNYPPDTLSAPETFERITKSLRNIEMLFVLNNE